jgi:hypothetical protein
MLRSLSSYANLFQPLSHGITKEILLSISYFSKKPFNSNNEMSFFKEDLFFYYIILLKENPLGIKFVLSFAQN